MSVSVLSVVHSAYPDWRLLSPCVYVLLSNKKESIYNRFLEALISLIGDVVPEKILIDFEQADLNAVSSLYKTEIKGCFFHLCQSFHRKLSELGLKKLMKTTLS